MSESKPYASRPAIWAAAWPDVERKIRRVPQYANARQVRIGEETVDPHALRPLCRLVRTYRLDGVQRLINTLDAATLPLFRGFWLAAGGEPERLIPPPLIEEHRGAFVIIDGLHRLYEARRTGRRAVVAVLRGELEPLPADVLTWDDVSLIDHPTRREDKFRNLDEASFRQINDLIDDRH